MKQKDELEAAEGGGCKLFLDAKPQRKCLKSDRLSHSARKELRFSRGSLTLSLPPFAEYGSCDVDVVRPLSPWDVLAVKLDEETLRHVIAWIRFHGLNDLGNKRPYQKLSQGEQTELPDSVVAVDACPTPARRRRRLAAAVQLEDDADSEVPSVEAHSADSD